MKTHAFATDILKQYVEKIERLQTQKSDIAQDITEIFKEAAGNGFDSKTIKQILKLRKMEAQELLEQDELLSLYREALNI
jgi:uncharacterized protein (UPF0335 family)